MRANCRSNDGAQQLDRVQYIGVWHGADRHLGEEAIVVQVFMLEEHLVDDLLRTAHEQWSARGAQVRANGSGPVASRRQWRTRCKAAD